MSPELKEGPKPRGCRLWATVFALTGLLVAGLIRGLTKR